MKLCNLEKKKKNEQYRILATKHQMTFTIITTVLRKYSELYIRRYSSIIIIYHYYLLLLSYFTTVIDHSAHRKFVKSIKSQSWMFNIQGDRETGYQKTKGDCDRYWQSVRRENIQRFHLYYLYRDSGREINMKIKSATLDCQRTLTVSHGTYCFFIPRHS